MRLWVHGFLWRKIASILGKIGMVMRKGLERVKLGVGGAFEERGLWVADHLYITFRYNFPHLIAF